MKRFFSPLAFSVIFIALSVALSSCQEQKPATPEEQTAAPAITDDQKEKPDAASEKSMDDAAAKEAALALQEEGEAIYQANCQSCHTMTPPAKSAPPIVTLAGQYRLRYSKKASAVDDMVFYMKNPSVGLSILGSKTFERFGIMPALSLPDEELKKVAGWLWDQYDPTFQGDGDCQ